MGHLSEPERGAVFVSVDVMLQFEAFVSFKVVQVEVFCELADADRKTHPQ